VSIYRRRNIRRSWHSCSWEFSSSSGCNPCHFRKRRPAECLGCDPARVAIHAMV
jgi:hypothetical protein